MMSDDSNQRDRRGFEAGTPRLTEGRLQGSTRSLRLSLGRIKLVPDRRSMVVLGSLVAAMTVASGVLLMLEPGPVAPPSPVSLQSIERDADPVDLLFSTTPAPEPGRWRGIVIHDSGATFGSLKTINRDHEAMGLGGVGYHFVIDNGLGERDGLIEASFRWSKQLIGAYSTNSDVNRMAIGVCLIGDADRADFTQAQMRELIWLVTKLQRHFNIPADNVVVNIGTDGTANAGRHFPLASFRQQLLTPAP
jgi:hypothetical protein